MTWEFSIVSETCGTVSEGPAWDGSGLLFSHIQASRIMRHDSQTGTTGVHRAETNCANGLMFDAQGRLHACEGDARRVVRYEADSTTTVLADRFESKRLNIPNDLAIDTQGRVWFTDPWYSGAAGDWSHDPATHKDLDHESVYRLDPRTDGTWHITRVTFDSFKPNGILFSLDHRTLYVAEHARVPDQPRELRAYAVEDDGSLGAYEVLHDFAPHRPIDGMCLDTEGHIIAPAGLKRGEGDPMVYVFSPSGDVVETHPLPIERPTNCTFGGPDLSTLYVTNFHGQLVKARTLRRGRLLFPAPSPDVS